MAINVAGQRIASRISPPEKLAIYSSWQQRRDARRRPNGLQVTGQIIQHHNSITAASTAAARGVAMNFRWVGGSKTDEALLLSISGFEFLVLLFSTFLVPCGRLSWLVSAFERTLKQHLESYRIVWDIFTKKNHKTMAIAEWVVLSAISSVCENFIGYYCRRWHTGSCCNGSRSSILIKPKLTSRCP